MLGVVCHIAPTYCASFIFTNRVVDAWSSLPNWIVMADSIGTVLTLLNAG